MNTRQEKAAEHLKKSLDWCHEVGLAGGVFDGKFCVWPKDTNPHQTGAKFFQAVEVTGRVIKSNMSLDGGAGV